MRRGPSRILAAGLALAAAWGGGSARADDPAIGAKAAAGIVSQISDLLQQNYPLPAISAAYAKALKDNQAHGRYDRLTACALADRLTQDLRTAHNDLHLSVSCHPGWVTQMMSPKDDDAGSAHYVVDTVWLDRDLHAAYVRSRGPWTPTREDFERVQNAMGLVAGARYLIIDITGNPGGSGDIGNFLASYLFRVGDDQPMNAGLHRDGSEEREQTFPYVPGPRFPDAQVYVLVDGKTASAAEGFAFALQRLKRVTLVGEQTAGAGIAAVEIPLAHGLSILTPNKLIVAPGTKTGWEGVGVKPDIAAKPGEELNVALDLIRREVVSKGLLDLPVVSVAPDGYVAPPAPKRDPTLKVTGHLEACSHRRIEGDVVTIVNDCGEEVTYQFLTSLRPNLVLEAPAKPGEKVTIGFASARGPYWWASSACPKGYYSDPPAREQYRDALTAGRYACAKPAL